MENDADHAGTPVAFVEVVPNGASIAGAMPPFDGPTGEWPVENGADG